MNGKRKTLRLTIPEDFLTKTPMEVAHDAIKMDVNMISRTQSGYYRELNIRHSLGHAPIDNDTIFDRVLRVLGELPAGVLEEVNEIVIWPLNQLK